MRGVSSEENGFTRPFVAVEAQWISLYVSFELRVGGGPQHGQLVALRERLRFRADQIDQHRSLLVGQPGQRGHLIERHGRHHAGGISEAGPYATQTEVDTRDVDLFMTLLDPTYVNLCPDTAQFTVAGSDPLAIAERLSKRRLAKADPKSPARSA